MASSSNFPSLVFFGNERLATGVTTQAPTLQALLEAGYPIEAVIVSNDAATSRRTRTLEIAELAQQHQIPVLSEFSSNLTSSIAVLVAYGRIVPKAVIDHFKHGIINVHPSALPRYRGSTPLESVILNGLESTAVSLMQLDVKMDAGPVFMQNHFQLNGLKSKQEVADAAGTLGAEMVIKALPQIIAGSLTPQPQDESQATFTKQITKQDGVIDWNKPAVQIERQIRAYAGWPGSQAQINDKEVIITDAEVIELSGAPGTFFVHQKQLAVHCGQQALLITQLKPAGKRAMPSRDFLAGNPIF